MKKNTFTFYVQDYSSNYLPNIRNVSTNTIKTYRYAFLDLIHFFKTNKMRRSSYEKENMLRYFGMYFYTADDKRFCRRVILQ